MLIDTTFTMECPKCGKNSLVKRQDEQYQCLACDFKKDLDKPESESSAISLAFAIALLLILIVTVAQHGITNACAPDDLQCIEQARSNR